MKYSKQVWKITEIILQDLYTRKEKLADGNYTHALLIGEKFSKNQEIDRAYNIKTVNFHENLAKIVDDQQNEIPIDPNLDFEIIQKKRNEFYDKYKYLEVYHAILQQ